MINKNIKKITGDLGNFINVDEIAWCDENGYIVNLESVDLNNREFNWTAEPGAYYISISKIFDTSDPTLELELCLIKQNKECALEIWYGKYAWKTVWEYRSTDTVVGVVSSKTRGYCNIKKRLILTEITKEMFETIREQLLKTRKFKFEIET
jgi:hypothetical protein